MLCEKCYHENSTDTCHYCKREVIRKKYSDKYLYDNIVRIEYQDWDTENDKYSNCVPDRYFQIRNNDEGCVIDIAGYVKRENADFDETSFQQMSGFNQFLYGLKRYRLEYVEKSVELTHIREFMGDDFLKSILAHYFFDSWNYCSESGNDEYSFLKAWPTFDLYTDYLRQYEKWSDSDIEEMRYHLSAFELVFNLKNGDQIFISGVKNKHSDELVEKIMSDMSIYLQFKNVIRINDWNHMFNASLDSNNFAKCIDVVDKCHNGKMAKIKLVEACFDNQYSEEDYVCMNFSIINKTDSRIFIYVFNKTVITSIGTVERIENSKNLIDELNPGETKEISVYIGDDELKHSYITPSYLIDRYGESFENPELFLKKISFQLSVEQGNDVDIEFSDWEFEDTEICDIFEDEISNSVMSNGHQSCIGTETEVGYKTGDILYIYKSNIRCHRYNHNIIQATAVLHNKTDDEIELNVEYCTKCKKFILEYTLFEQYRSRYGVLVGNFRMVANGEFDGKYDLAEESPLMLSGYNVSQRDGYNSRERHYILARIIHDGIMDKGEVIRYLSYFIRKNGAKRGNELALSKWEDDLAFVQEYDISTQPRVIIKDIKKYNN